MSKGQRDDIRNNGRKKLLIIGKTGTGKSSLCNVISGYFHDAEFFPVSPTVCRVALGYTYTTKLADIFFNNDESRPLSLIDTTGFKDPMKNAEIILDLVTKLKNKVDYINTFVIAVIFTEPRLDESLVTMIKSLEEMFGKEFWKQTLIVFTNRRDVDISS